MDNKEIETTVFFLESWLNETIGSCDRFLSKINGPTSFDDEFHKRRMFEEHYVLTATVMSIRFARQLINHENEDFKKHIKEFINSTKNAVDVRDMREHSDEYFIGKGKKHGDFFKGSNQHIRCDMTSSIKNEHGYMLGNLIAMEFIQSECKKLLKSAHVNLK